MWRWRDWVIGAFNRNMPYDQFTIEQLAGDMLPNATLDQKIASGFNRNHRGNGEGGIVPEEYAVEYVVDRVDTTSTVWLGLTLGCARCHDHKYDPIAQKEFYQLYAYFNNIPERGMAFKYGNSPPFIQAPTPPQQAQLRELDRRLLTAEQRFKANADGGGAGAAGVGEVARSQLEARLVDNGRSGGSTRARASSTARASSMRAMSPTSASMTSSRFRHGYIRRQANGAILTRAKDEDQGTGYGLYLKDGKVAAVMVLRWLDDGVRLETEAALPLHQWSHVALTYDGSRMADGVKIYINGEPQKVKVALDVMNQTFAVKEPLRIGGGGGPENRFHGSIDEVRIYNASLTPGQAAVLATRDSIPAIAAIDPAKRSRAQSDKMRLSFLDRFAPEEIRQAWRQLQAVRRERQRLLESFPTVMVMQERAAASRCICARSRRLR